jgi:hypothetical protein
MTEAVLTTTIAGGFTIVVALIGIAARYNKRDHDVNTGKLDLLLKGHERIESKIDTHINDHAKGDL